MNSHKSPIMEKVPDKSHKTLRPVPLAAAGLTLLLLLFLISIMTGAAKLPLKTVTDAFLAFQEGNSAHLLVRDMRVPRALAAICVGAALAVSGAIMQGVTRNPLADSGLMGLSAGAGLFLAVTLVFFQGASYSLIVLLTFLGSACGAGLVILISRMVPGGNPAMKLVLAGAAVSTLFSAISQSIAIVAGASQNLLFWTMGNVSGTSGDQLKIAAPVILISVILAILLSRQISILSMGEEMAKALGVNTKITRAIAALLVIVLSGTSFALCGSITFVGIMIPHFARFLTGADYRRIIPLSACFGAVLVTGADILAKTVNSPSELPLGAVISCVGVIVFLYFASKERRKAE